METQKYVAYLRRSKKEQQSTLGLDAQQAEVARYVGAQNGQIIRTFVEIESGTSRKLGKRVVLWQAIDECKKENATLIIAKLDRLARDVEFTSKLMNAGVKFVACDIPQANEFTIHVMAAVAEQEAKRISERTKMALAQKKAKGAILGWAAHKTRFGCPFDDNARKKAGETNRAKSLTNPNNTRARGYAASLKKRGKTLNEIASIMNSEGFKSPYGNSVTATTVMRWIESYEELTQP